MNTTEETVSLLARVHDDALSGQATGTGARTLLAAITATPPAPAPPRASRMRLRLTVGALVTGVAATTAIVIPGLLAEENATVYANSAIELERDGDEYVARIKDPFADHRRYTEAFSAVGIKMDIRLVPVSPSAVGKMTQIGSSGGSPGRPQPLSGGSECEDGETTDCPIVVRLSVDYSAHGWIKIGRAARPGESYQNAGSAARKGEALEGVAVREGRKVSEILPEAGERGLAVIYSVVRVTPPGKAGEAGGGPGPSGAALSFEPISADKVGPGWRVWDAEAVKAGAVRLLVTPGPLPKNPLYD
ncbi:hypothetical protein [Streptosporangium sp. KLBMP 9127]|nr:hypothetical protein [Streptosporangium sp. KLBMP 9127]